MMYPHTTFQAPSAAIVHAATYLETFIDPYVRSPTPLRYPCYPPWLLMDRFEISIASILTCRFMLSLRQFESTIHSATFSGPEPQLREHMASKVLPFGARPGGNLPTFIASFSHPVHVESDLSEDRVYPDMTVDEGSEGEDANVAVSGR